MLDLIGGTKLGSRVFEEQNYLDSILPSTVMDLDATVVKSYGGGGNVWANLTAAPADGAARGDYDFWLGDGIDDERKPDFMGSAGSKAAYWESAGAGSFRIKGGNTDFVNSLCKSAGQDFWVAVAMRGVTSVETDTLMTTSERSQFTEGMWLQTLSAGNVRIGQRGATGVVNGPGVALTAGTDRLFIISKSHSANKMKTWTQTNTISESNHTFNAMTGDPSGIMTLMDNEAGTDPQPAGVRLYSFAMGNKYITTAEANLLIAHMEARHGRVYMTVT